MQRQQPIIVSNEDGLYIVPLNENNANKVAEESFENFKTYLSFTILNNLIHRTEEKTQIRSYREKQLKEITELLISHTNEVKRIGSLKPRIEQILQKYQSPGFIKQIKRSAHGKEFPKYFSEALNDGENKEILLAMQALKIAPENLILTIKWLSHLIPHHNKAVRTIVSFFSHKEKNGDNLIGFKRYLIYVFFKTIIEMTKSKKVIRSNAKLYLERVLELLYDSNPISIHDLINCLCPSGKAFNNISLLTKLEIEKIREENKYRKITKDELLKIEDDLTNTLNLINVMGEAIVKAQNSNVQLVMSNLAVPFESYYNLFTIIGIHIKPINHNENLEKIFKVNNQNLLGGDSVEMKSSLGQTFRMK